ncbi:MAG TPA: hypothetical protein VM492_10655, partial [Sumerlaeia bacterium]|nr:hypothetical protein [Sumerlaeia bacterium]
MWGLIGAGALGLAVGLARSIPKAAACDRSTPDRRDQAMSDVTGNNEKSRLREEIRAARRAIERSLRDDWNKRIEERLLECKQWEQAESV